MGAGFIPVLRLIVLTVRELLEISRYALARFGMALFFSLSPPYPHFAGYSNLLRHLTIHWHNFHLPLPWLQTST